MSSGAESGPLVAATEDLYRAILYPHWWVDDQGRPSSAAFDHEVLSVDLKSRTTPRQTAARFHNVTRLAEFNCGRASAIGFETRDEPDPQQPDNPAHAHVYMLEYFETNPSQRKKKAKRLAEICRKIAI